MQPITITATLEEAVGFRTEEHFRYNIMCKLREAGVPVEGWLHMEVSRGVLHRWFDLDTQIFHYSWHDLSDNPGDTSVTPSDSHPA